MGRTAWALVPKHRAMKGSLSGRCGWHDAASVRYDVEDFDVGVRKRIAIRLASFRSDGASYQIMKSKSEKSMRSAAAPLPAPYHPVMRMLSGS